MEQNKPLSTPKHRITVIDALRGFALLGVILMHMMQHYGIFSGAEPGEALFPQMDKAIQWLSQHVIMGKFINIFAFLFGLSFFIQMDAAAKKGVDFRKRFLWRMAILFGIGMIGNCFYTGDILSIYAVFGVFMVFLFRFKNRVLLILVSLLLIGLPRVVTTTYSHWVKTEQAETVSREPVRRSPAPDMEKPSFFKSAQKNLTSGLQGKLNYQFGLYGRGYITLALFMLGLVVGRLRFFEEVHIRKRRNLILLAGFVLAALVMQWLIHLLPEPPSTRAILMGLDRRAITPSVFVVMALKDIHTVLFSGVMTMGFIVLYQIKSLGRYLDVISPYGRMGLTNYEMQNVIGCLLFSMWGLGSTVGRWGATEVFALGLVLYVVQMLISMCWLKYHLYGPLEWLWRSATYLKRQPLRKRNPSGQVSHEEKRHLRS